jgi:tRNA A-37 threonylcarbamoyl transferase component Bud32
MKIMRIWLRESLVDEKLPQLRELLDPVTMREILLRELQQRYIVTASFNQCRITRVKYRPGKNCLITYQLIDQRAGDSHVAIITVLGCRAGESSSAFAASQSLPPASTGIGDLIFHLPELEAVAWIFPADRKLSGLPALTDSANLKAHRLPQIIRQSDGPDWVIIESVIEPVSYFAERSYTTRAELSLHHAQTNALVARTLYAKTYCVGESERAWRGQTELWESDERKSGRLFIPQPLLLQPEIETIWQEGLNGTMLDAKRDEHDFAEMLERAGEAVAALHRTKVETGLTATSTEMVRRLETVSELLSQVRPSCRRGLQDVVSRLSASVPESRAVATLHGDLHLKNLLVVSGRIALLDLDNLVIGDPLADLGSFAAAIQEAELCRTQSPLAGDEIIERFIRGYRRGSDDDLSVSGLCWWMAAALIAERAWRFVTKLKAERAGTIDDLIELARITVAGAEQEA